MPRARRQPPDRDELFDDAEFERIVQGIARRPGMWVGSDRLDVVLAHLDGRNDQKPTLLLGMKPWLCLQFRTGTNLYWAGLIKWKVSPRWSERERTPAEHRKAIRMACRIILQFLRYRRENGLTRIYHDYAKWLLSTSWYRGPLRSSPGRKPK